MNIPDKAHEAAARVLRGAAKSLPAITHGEDGLRCWPADKAEAYMLAIEEAQRALEAIADELEPS